MKRGTAILALSMAVVAVHNEAMALVICARRSGNLVLRAACKRKETQVDLSQLGPTGPRGPQGAQGPTGSTGPTGPAGVAGTATAYAVVDPIMLPAPSFVASKTMNFVAVTKAPFTGVYCLTPAAGIDPAVRPALVAPEWGLSTPDLNSYFTYVNAYSGSTNCPATDFEVETYILPTGGSTVPDAQPSDGVAFVIIVP
jgi:hypothetical protein